MVEQSAKNLRPVPLGVAPLEDALKWSTVSLSEIIARGSRLEASVYDVKGKQARETLARCRWQIVNLWSDEGFASQIYYPTRFKRHYVLPDVSESIGFLGSAEMLDTKPKPIKFLSKGQSDIEAVSLPENCLLLSRSGTIGKVTFASETLRRFLVSEHAIRIICPQNVGFVYAFLKTETGQSLIKSHTYGAVVDQVEPEHLAEIPIPNPQALIKIEIHNLVMNSFALRDASNELLDEAERLLINELNLPPIEELKAEYFDDAAELKIFTVKLSELAERIEASYHKPLVRAISEHIAKHADQVTTLGDARLVSRIILPSRFKRVYVEKGQGVLFFGGKELLQLAPAGEKFLSLKHHDERIKKELTLEENMVMITASGTIGKVALVPKHWTGWTANQHIIRTVPASPKIAGYIYAWLNTDYGKELITRFTYGAVVDEIDHRHAAQIEIPLLKNEAIQQQINDLVLEANRKRYEAYLLEQQAIHTINEKVIYA